MMRPENHYLNGILSSEELLSFIQGKLDDKRIQEIELILKSSYDDFKHYVALKESLHFMEDAQNKPKPSPDFMNSILSQVKKQPILPHIQFLIRHLKDKVIVSSSDNVVFEIPIISSEELRYSKLVPITILRNVKGYELKFHFQPSEDGYCNEVHLSLSNPKSMEVSFIENEIELKTIDDLSENTIFLFGPQIFGDLEFIFKRRSRVLFTFGFSLRDTHYF
jgi:hypothetical protein